MITASGKYRLPDHARPFFGRARDAGPDAIWGGVPWERSQRVEMSFVGLSYGSLQRFPRRDASSEAIYWEAAAKIDGDGPSPVHTRADLAAMDSPGCWGKGTSLQWAKPWKTADGDDTRHCDSRTFFGIVIPPALMAAPYGLRTGDLALVCYSGKVVYAQVYDVGPPYKLGEMSIGLARELGIGHDPRKGNAVRDMVYLAFPGTRPGGKSLALEPLAQWRAALDAWNRLTGRAS